MTLKDILTMHTIMNSGNLVYKDLVDKAIESAKDGKRYCEREYDASKASASSTNEFIEDMLKALKDLEKQGIDCRWSHHTKGDFHKLDSITVYMEW